MPTVFEHAHGSAIARRAQRRPYRHRRCGRMLVFRQPRALIRVDGSFKSIDDAGRRISILDRRRIDERLERRAGLALRLQRTVQPDACRIAAADDRAHFAGRPDRARSATPAAALSVQGGLPRGSAEPRRRADARLDFSQRADDGGLGGLLHVRVDRRIDAQPSLINGVLPEPLDS